MRFIIFKETYEFPVPNGKLIIDPVERIRRGLKTTTCRLKQKRLGGLRCIHQGNLFHPKIPSDFWVRFTKREKRTIPSLTKEEIQGDLGLTDAEFALILSQGENYHHLFLEGLQKINHNPSLTFRNVFHLHYLQIIWKDSSKNEKRGTLDMFLEPKKRKKTLEAYL